MEGNGHYETASFGWVQSRILLGLEREGHNPHDLQYLREKLSSIGQLLENFHTERRTLADSSRYTAIGLQDLLQERAAAVAGEITRLLDATHLKEHIRQTAQKLRAKQPGDVADRIIPHFEQMELRTMFQGMGILLPNLETGGFTVDTVKADALYRDAMARGDHRAMEALEGWPLGSPVSPKLVAHGRQLREEAFDPINSAKLRELRRLEVEMERIRRDALNELPLAQADPIAAMARGEIGAEESD